MTDNLIERLGDEADQCRNDGADDIAKLLDEARAAIEKDRERQSVPAFDSVRLTRFLTDVVTAAGLLSHGKQSKAVAERVAKEACAIRSMIAAAPTEAKPAQPDCSGGMPCTDCPNKRKCQAGCMRQEEALERPNREEPSQRHPLDVEALHELQKVMADFGGDWPDVPGEQEVVRRAKMLSRLWKADRLVGSERIEAAAKVLAASMCYQWDSMLEEDRDTMRKTAEAIIRAASAAASPDQSDPDAWECSGCGGSGKQTAYDAHGFGHNLAYFVPCGVCDGVGFCGPDAARRAAEAKPAPKVSESRPVLYSDEYVTQQPEAPETGAAGWTHWEARIKQLMEDIGQSHSRSVYQAFSQLVNEATRLAAAPDAKPATQPICDGCGKTIPEHDALLRCKAESTQQASGEQTAIWARWLADQAPPSGSKLIESWAPNVIECLRRCAAALSPAQQDAVDAELEPYGAGLLNDFGGGNVEWWQDYIRAELARAHGFYQSQIKEQDMLTVEQVFDAIRHLYGADRSARMAIKHSMDEFRAIEAAACAERDARIAELERQLAEALKASIGEPVAEVKAQSDSIGGTFIQRYAELAPGTKLYTSPQAAQPLKPDMFWNSDDADEPHDSIECFLNDQICQHDLEVGAVFTIWQAKKLPSVTIRVTAIDEEECEAEYEVVEQAHGITKGTT